MAWHIRNNRSKNPLIKTRQYKRKADQTEDQESSEELTIEELNNLILYMKNKFVNTEEDKEDIRDGMNKTYQNRFKWIKDCSP